MSARPADRRFDRHLARVAILLSAIVLLAPITHLRAQSVGGLQIQAQAGFQGYFRPGQPTPVQVDILNPGAALTGSVRVAAQPVTAASNTFSTAVDLPSGADKTITLLAILSVSTQHLQIDVLDVNGAIIGTATATANALNAADSLYGIVDGAPNPAIDLSMAHQPDGKAYPVSLSIDSLPDTALGMAPLSGLVFASADTSQLSTAQRNAIGEWVANGGRLIAIGGPDWQITAAGLDQLLPFHPSGTATLENLNALAGFSAAAMPLPDSTSVALNGTTLVAQGKIDPTSRVVLGQGDQPLVITRGLGTGEVDYLTFDPNLDPFKGWADRARFWQKLLIDTAAVHPGWTDGLINTPIGATAASVLVGLQLPQVIVVGGFLLFYVLLIGPVNYLILRALKRPEWAWVTTPVLIAIATVGSYQIGLSLRGTQPILTQLGVVQSWPGQPTAHLSGVLGVTAPQQSRYDLTVDSAILQPITSGGNVGLLNTSSSFATDQTSDAAGLHSVAANLALGSEVTRTFSITGDVPAPALSGNATVTVNTDGSMELDGTIANDTAVALERPTLIMLDISFPLDSIPAGGHQPFSFHVKPPLHAALLNGESAQPVSQASLAVNGGITNAFSTRDLLAPTIAPELAVNGADVLNLTDRRVQGRRVDLLDAFIDPAEYGGGRGLQVYLVGWQASAPFQATLNNADTRAENDTLQVVALSMHISSSVSTVTLTPGYFTWQPIAVDTAPLTPSPSGSYASSLASNDPYNLYIPANQKVAFEFAPRAGINPKQVNSLTVFGQVVQTDAGAISLWDWQASQWVSVVTPVGSLSAPQRYDTSDPADLARFIGNGGKVRVLVESVNGIADYQRVDVSFGTSLDVPLAMRDN